MACQPRSLSVHDLVAFDVVPSLVSAARLSGLSELFPLQERAVRSGLLTSPSGSLPDLVLLGRAGQGKRSICDLAAAHHAHSGHKVLLVCASQQAVARCVRRLSVYTGLRVGEIALPSDLHRLDIAVADLQRADRLLRSREPERLGLGFLICEELESLVESDAGELWPQLLLRCQADERHHRDEAAGLADGPAPWVLRVWCALVSAGSAGAVVFAEDDRDDHAALAGLAALAGHRHAALLPAHGEPWTAPGSVGRAIDAAVISTP
mgnify:CR=1 FL=1